MLKDHRRDRDRTANQHRHDRYQQRPQAQDGIKKSTHRTSIADFSGGADRDRTGGLLVANQALSQLSYSPKFQHPALSRQRLAKPARMMSAECQVLLYVVGLGRLELPTSPLSGVRSSHLSYRPGSTAYSFA